MAILLIWSLEKNNWKKCSADKTPRKDVKIKTQAAKEPELCALFLFASLREIKSSNYF